MPRGKKELAEQIIPKLREVEVEVGRGKTVLEAVKKIGVTEQTYYRWKKKFGGLRIDQAKRLKDLEKENARLKRLLADAELDSGVSRGSIGTPLGGAAQLLSPAKRRRAVEHVRGVLGRDRLSERRACRVLGQHRNTQRRQRHVPDDEPRLVTRIVWLACEYGRYGYRRITGLLHWEGWRVNHKRVERIWREEGLKVPKKQPKRRRLWLNDGSCIRLRPTHRNHVWSYDFVMDRTSDGRPIRMLTIMDEFTRECLAIDVAKRLTSEDVLERLSDLFVHRGVPEHIRSDNGSEFTAKCVREWLGRVGVKTLFIEPGSPWENGYVESFNGKLRDELLEREAFDTLLEAKVLIERWRQHYNTIRPHSALGYRPPAPEAMQPCAVATAAPPQPHRAGLVEGKTLT